MSILLQDTQLERFLSVSRIAKGATTGDASERSQYSGSRVPLNHKKDCPRTACPSAGIPANEGPKRYPIGLGLLYGRSVVGSLPGRIEGGY